MARYILEQKKDNKVDPYHELKPSAIKTHLMATERLLNYDVENDILNK